MTNEEAIKVLCDEWKCIDRNDGINCDRQCEKCDLVMDSAILKDAYNMAIKALEQQPSDTVSRGAYEQVMWERDVAIEQLKELGYELGQKVETCENVIDRDFMFSVLDNFCGHDRTATITLDTLADIVYELPSVTQKSAKDYLDMADRKAKKIKDALTDNSQSGCMMIWHCDYVNGIFVSWYTCPSCGYDTRNQQYTWSDRTHKAESEEQTDAT